MGSGTALAAVPRPLTALLANRPEPIPPIQNPRIKELVQKGLDAAQAAGADYADIRMTYTRSRRYSPGGINNVGESEALHVGVRALVKGYWGFAASPVWSTDELVRLGREATRQAKGNSLGKPRDVVLPPLATVTDKHWETPIKHDPFALHPLVINDYLAGLYEKLANVLGRLDRFGSKGDPQISVGYSVVSQEKAFGATMGSYLTQRLVRSNGNVRVVNHSGDGDANDLLTSQAVGWELFTDNDIIGRVQTSIEENRALARLPRKPIDVGRYAAVFDAASVARLVSQSIGSATQIDRALGYEANAGGTSYLVDPDEMLGSYIIASPQITIHANRSEAGGCATTGWDDEGVAPTDCTLVEQGFFTDFHTSREGAGWLKPAYERLERPFRSHGHAYSETAKDAPMVHTANLVMAPGSEALSHRDLETNMGHGMSIMHLNPAMDFQLSGGFANSMLCLEVKNGERTAIVTGAGILFRTSELWKGVTAIGGPASARRIGTAEYKGEPRVTGHHSVTAVPMAIKEMTFIDRERR